MTPAPSAPANISGSSANEKPLRVLIASPTAELGGAEQVILTLAERLPAHGVQASFALLRPGTLQKTIEDRGMTAHVFPEEYRFRDVGSVLRAIKWLTDCLKTDQADILHSNLTAHFIGGWAARRAHVPELWHLHDFPFGFDIVHAISQRVPPAFTLFTTQFVQSGEPRARRGPHTVVHPNCVDVEKLSAAPFDRAVRERLGIGDGPFFLTVTRLQEHKGHKYLIDAAAKIAEAFPEIRWVIAGRARDAEQEAYLAGLRDQIAAHGLEKRFVFPGFVGDGDLAPLFKEAIALVHPAVTEGYGLVLLEAMSYGVPVIVAAAEGPAEIIVNDKNGLMVPVRDSAALADAMSLLLQNPALAARLKAQASQDVQSKSVEGMVAQTVAVYRQMLAATSR